MTAQEITALKLRDYQTDIVQQVFEQWSSGYNALLIQLPTGAGKTIIFTAVANEFVTMGEPVLVIAHRTELITQAASKLETL